MQGIGNGTKHVAEEFMPGCGNLQIYPLDGGYTNTLLYDGEPLLATPHSVGRAPPETRRAGYLHV
jgi:hypothetical protein